MSNGRQHRFALPAGYKLHWYEIDSVLGQGGFGITYLARDTNLDHWVAIKEFLPSDLATRTHDSTVEPISDGHSDTYGWGLQRFVTEAKTLVKFRHPNIVLIHNVFEANNTAYMVMEYVEGRTLEDALKFKRIEGEAEFKRIILALLDGLEHIHDAGFIHRDIKPENIFLRDDGTPVLLDFGSARQALGGKTRTLTALVSPGYAPYEQYDSSRSGESKQGPWTDIYALGATLYRAVTGKGPIEAMARVNAAMEGENLFEPASRIAQGAYSEDFLKAIDWALELRPKRRPQTISEWRKVLTGEHQPDAVTEVVDASKAQPIELPETPAPATAEETSAAAPAAETTKPEDTDQADTSPAMELPARKAQPKPPSPGPAPAKSEPTKSRGGLAAIAAVVILAAVGGAVYFGGLLSKDPGEVAPVSTAPPAAPEQQVVAVEEELSPEEAARRRAEEAKQKAAELQKQLEEQQKQLEEQKRLAEAEAAKLTELETARRRTERLAQLLAEAESDLQAGRLVQPAKANALFRFKEVLALDPENADAKAGLERVVAGIVGRANAATERRAFSEAENLLAEADVVLPGTDVVAKARADLANAARAAEEEKQRIAEAKKREAEEAARRKAQEERQAKVKTLLALAEQDLKAGRLVSPEGNNALVRYRDVLKIETNNTAATIGIEAVVTGLLTLGSESASQQNFAAASSYLQQAEAIDPNSKQVLDARSRIATAQQAFELEQKKLAEAEQKRAEAERAQAEEARKRTEAAKAAAAAESGAAEKVDELLAKANNDLKVLRLTSPPGRNAFERFKKVLELDPGNSEAESGILQVGEKYLELKDKAIAQQNFDKAKGYIDKAEQVLPGSELIAIARDEYEIAKAEYQQAGANEEAAAAAEANRQESEQLAKAQAELERLKAEQEKLKRQMQTQRAPQQAASAATTQAPGGGTAANGPLSVAIFPFERQVKLVNDADHLLPEFSQQYVSGNRGLRLLASYYGNDSSKIGDKADYWSAGHKPLEKKILTDAARIGADAVLMYSYTGRTYINDMFDLEVYVFDARSGRAYNANANQGNYKEVTDRLFKELVASPVAAPEQRRASVAPQQAASVAQQPATAATGRLRVAILPFWGRDSWNPYTDAGDAWLAKLSKRIISTNSSTDLVFLFNRDDAPEGLKIQLEQVWPASGNKRQPDEGALARIGSGLNADVVLLYKYFLSWNYVRSEIKELDVYAFDVAGRKLYSRNGSPGALDSEDAANSATPLIESVISEIAAARGRYIPRQTDAAAASAEATTLSAPLVSGKRRVAILPFWGWHKTLSYTDFADQRLSKILNNIVSNDPRLELVYSPYGEEVQSRTEIDASTLWERLGNDRIPRQSVIASAAKSLVADAVLTLGYEEITVGAVQVETIGVRLDIYVFDARNNKLIKKQGDLKNAKSIISNALEELLGSERAGQSGAVITAKSPGIESQ